MKYVLGIDTSNYTTSIALIDGDFNIIDDKRKMIKVKKGMKGIRQSEALFQHVENLPDILKDTLSEYSDHVEGVCVSDSPRPFKDSYMPVFKAGINAGKLISYALNIPLFFTSHQEGHIEAGKFIENDGYSPFYLPNKDLAIFHLSGGTTEIIFRNKVKGGTKDISFGQLLDRIGVKCGLSFPSGKLLDEIAINEEVNLSSHKDVEKYAVDRFGDISRSGLDFNLSGLETQVLRLITEANDNKERNLIILSVFYLIARCLKALTTDLKKQYNVRNILFVGGVTSSKFIRNYLLQGNLKNSEQIHFGKPVLSVDNAVGVAFIGGRKLWL